MPKKAKAVRKKAKIEAEAKLRHRSQLTRALLSGFAVLSVGTLATLAARRQLS